MNKLISVKKAFFFSLFFSIILAAPFAALYNYFSPSEGSIFVGNLLNNIYIATFFGFMFFFPFMLGFSWGLWFWDQYKKIVSFIIIPSFLINLIWAMDGFRNFILPFSLSLLFAVMGGGVGLLIRFLYPRVLKE